MAFDAFLKLDGITGEVTTAGHEGEIEVSSFSWGVSNVTNVGSSTGGGAGKASFNEFSITKTTDSASPALFLDCAAGRTIQSATLSLNHELNGGTDEFMKVVLTDVFVTSFQEAGAEQGDDRPTEEVSFAFAKLEFVYEASPTGQVIDVSWDIQTNSGG
ncbi:MAG TPA: type VI secretion system tube protein Hcp [Gaiellaceae bacterium]